VAEFDPVKFEDKYVHYFEELQQAYKNAYQSMHDHYDSTLLRAIDRQVLDESGPVYEGDGEFRVVLPDDPIGRMQTGAVDAERLEATLQEFVDRIELQLRRLFEFESEAESKE
jgi:hypothetical protein